MKILWVSNHSTLPTAYGQQTALVVPRLRAAGHEVTIFATAGCEGAPERLADGTLVLPRLRDRFGNDVVLNHAEFVKPDLVVTLLDPHVLLPEVYGKLPWCAYAPIDCAPPRAAAIRALRAARWIWSPSAFGARQIEYAVERPVRHVPHGVDPGIFHPGDRTEARRRLTALGFDEEDFLVSMVAANREDPPRKGFDEALAALRMFRIEVPEARLYLHADEQGVFGGVDLGRLVRRAGVEDRVLFAPQYQLACGMLGPPFVADVYRASDVVLSTSHGEGACLPLIEAQMCGTPVLAADNTSQTEVTPPASRVLCSPYRMLGEASARFAPEGVATLAALRAARAGRFAAGDVSRFAIDRVVSEHVLPAIEEIAAEVSTR